MKNNSGSYLTLDSSDFDYDKTSKALTLSSSGLIKFQNEASMLNERQSYKYAITFKFTTSSDRYTNKEASIDVGINLIKAHIITKTDIENMMKTIKYSDAELFYAAKEGEIIIASGTKIGRGALGISKNTFSFSNSSFSSIIPNFSLISTPTLEGNFIYTARDKRIGIANAIEDSAPYKMYFLGDIDYSTVPMVVGKEAIFTFKFNADLNKGYVLSKEVSHITNTGLTIKLTLTDSGEYTATW